MDASMDVEIDFKTHFYNLEGVHYNERKKNFSKLLNSTNPTLLAQTLDIQPRNHLEKIFYVDVLVHAKQVDKLFEILKDGNGVLTSKILKQKWFFEEAFKNMSEDAIVNEFLPTLPYTIRMKVLKKMSLSFNEKRMDNMFDLVLQRYGLFIARQFLFSCSSTKIIDVLKNNEITLSVEQLKRILDRDSNLVKIYFEELKKNTGNSFDDLDFLSYMVRKYPNLYFEFGSVMENYVKIGRHTTKSVLKLNQEEVLRDVNQMKQRFNIAVVTRVVKDFDKEYFPTFFPKDMSSISDYSNRTTLESFLKKYPQKNRWSVFSSGFKKAYNDDAVNHLKIFDQNIVNMFPNEVKLKWAEIKFKETDDIKYINYFDPKQAFVLLKERINLTSDIYKRRNILTDLVRICHTNKDYDTFEQVLKYICLRHRNEETFFRERLLQEISCNMDYDLTTATLWKYINEMVDIFRVKGERVPLDNVRQYLIFLIKNKLPLDEPITQYIKDCVNQNDEWSFGVLDKDLKMKSEVMKHLMKFLHTIEPESKKKIFATALMKEIVKFNTANKTFSINLNESPVIMGFVKQAIKEQDFDVNDMICIRLLILNNYSRDSPKLVKVCDDSQLLDTIKYMTTKKSDIAISLSAAILEAIKKPRTTEFQNSLLDFYFTKIFTENDEYFGRKKAVDYFTNNEPAVIAKYFDQILPVEVNHSMFNYSILKLYSHLALDEKLITHFRPLVSANSTCESKLRMIDNLSKIMSPQDFINLMTVYLPQQQKIDLLDSEQNSLYQAQCATAKALKNLDDAVKLIPLLYPFCQGDYLQSSLPLLYKVLYRINEDLATQCINLLVEKAVSTRKHAAYLSFEVLPQKNALDLFNIIATREKNVSAKKYLFKGVLNYFIKNPSEYILNLVITSLTFIDKNDKELLESLIDAIKKVTRKFKSTFLEHSWNFLEVLEKNDVNVLVYKTSLISTINTYDTAFFLTIKESFCQSVIQQYFCPDGDGGLKSGCLYSFVAKYLLAYKDDKQFEFVFNIIKKYKDMTKDMNNLKYVLSFFDHVYKLIVEEDIVFLKMFKTHWERLFINEECFVEYVLLHLMVLYKESSTTEAFAKEVSIAFQALVLQYGPYLNGLLAESIKTFFANTDSYTLPITSTDFALELLKFDQNELNCFIVCDIIADWHWYDTDKKVKCSKIIEILKLHNSFVVRVYCNNLFRNP